MTVTRTFTIVALCSGCIAPKLLLPLPPSCGFHVVELRDASIGWPGEPPLLTRVNLVVENDMRVIVRGPNGAGKSSLVKALAGELALQQGSRKVDPRLALGYATASLALPAFLGVAPSASA